MFYFQTNCSSRTVGNYFNISSSKVIRATQQIGAMEYEFSLNIGINKDVRVIGIDEKWIKIKETKNKWSYLFKAVDMDSGDILYVDVFENRNDMNTKIFLLGLKARGYNPEFIVSDLYAGYTRMIPEVFGRRVKQVHCFIHFCKNLYSHFQDVYGKKFKEKNPDAYRIYVQFRNIFQCKSAKTARKRYFEAFTLESSHPEAEKIFSYLKNHFRHMMYPLEYANVPQTNNITEGVIKRFCRQIKNSCGFESVESARLFLRAYQVVYRMTPYRKDNKNKDIRGKLPVEVSFNRITKKRKFCQLVA